MPPRSSEPVDVSVVVATRNRAELLPGHLESLVRQELPPDLGYEVILVDDGSEDETPEVLARACADRPDLLRWMSVPHAGMGLARNAGARAARGRLLLFTDDDVIVPPSWVAGLVDLHARHGTAALSGGFDPLSTSARPERYLHHRMRLLFGDRPRPVRAAPMMSFLVEQDAFWSAGGFDALMPLEDWRFCERLAGAGHRITYDPGIRIVHRYQTSWGGVLDRLRATAARGIYDRMDAGGSGLAYLAFTAARCGTSPIWALWRFPLDLYPVVVWAEAVFLAHRVRAWAARWRGRPLATSH